MTHTDIERVPVRATTELLASTSIAAKSKMLLGYDPQHVAVFGPLAQALAALGIQPLNRVHVLRYKRSKEHRGMTDRFYAGMLATTILLSYLAWTVVSTVSALRAHHDPTGRMVLCMLIQLIGWIATWVILDGWEPMRKVRRWELVSIQNYGGYVPEHVISQACEIKAAQPATKMFVDRLVSSNEYGMSLKALRDPFLVVELDRESFYIDVWNEPDFERKLLGKVS